MLNRQQRKAILAVPESYRDVIEKSRCFVWYIAIEAEALEGRSMSLHDLYNNFMEIIADHEKVLVEGRLRSDRYAGRIFSNQRDQLLLDGVDFLHGIPFLS
jgi:hypothetical protein